MVHTATLTYEPQKGLYKRFIELNGSRWIDKYSKYINTDFRDNGIKVIGYEIHKGNGIYNRYCLTMVVNFKRLIEQDNHVLIYKESDYEQVVEQFNAVMNELGLPAFENWKVNRIDYCFNCETPYVKEYIKLLKKADRSRFHHVPYNENRNYSMHKGSCYVVGKSTTINFYDKQDQLINESKTNPRITEEMIQDAENILRLEIQCKKPKTEYIRYKNNRINPKEYWDSKYIDYYMSYDVALDILQRHIEELRVIMDYTTKKKALKLISASKYHNHTKEKLTQIIHDVAKQHSSIYKVRKSYQENGVSAVKFTNMLKQIEALGINVVTLPRDGLKELDSVYSLLEKSYEIERSFDYEINDDMGL